MKDFVFVYGSLKQGEWNNSVLGGSELVASEHTLEDFLLIDCGFPFAIDSQSADETLSHLLSPILGEVYQVEREQIMHDLDCLEGEGSMYRRRRVKINNLCEPVWMYVAIGMDGNEYPLTDKEEGQWVWNRS